MTSRQWFWIIVATLLVITVVCGAFISHKVFTWDSGGEQFNGAIERVVDDAEAGQNVTAEFGRGVKAHRDDVYTKAGDIHAKKSADIYALPPDAIVDRWRNALIRYDEAIARPEAGAGGVGGP